MYRAARNMVLSTVRDLSMATGIGSDLVFRKYSYMFPPQALITLARLVEEVRNVEGAMVEAGCAYGATTVWLKKYMQQAGIQKRYVAIDTFSGFVPEHVDHETRSLGKPRAIGNFFTVNKKSWYDYKLRRDGIDDVESVESDVTKYDFKALGPVAFCLIDVDLYVPVKDILPKIYDQLPKGGVIAVDDCEKTHVWNGAYFAYEEFVKSRNLPMRIEANVLGIVKKE